MNMRRHGKRFSIPVIFLILFVSFPSLAFCVQDYQDAERKFHAFQYEWLGKLRVLTGCSSEVVTIEPNGNGDGGYIATYREIGDPSLVLVKPTGEKGVPFVGTIRYDESFFQSEGATPEEAKAGEYTCVKIRRTTEIFYYRNGRWIK